MKVVIILSNNEIVILYQEIGKFAELKKIKNDIANFKQILRW